MPLDSQIESYIRSNQSAAMVTLRTDGSPHAVRVGVGIVDGRIWSSGTQARSRTRHLRRDPRATLFIFDSQFRWLTLECTVNILDGPDAPQCNLRLMEEFQGGMQVEAGKIAWFGRQLTHDEFIDTMIQEQRLIYEFEPVRYYGMHGGVPTSP
jgi:PPOX class probable F420-dependent enzyme